MFVWSSTGFMFSMTRLYMYIYWFADSMVTSFIDRCEQCDHFVFSDCVFFLHTQNKPLPYQTVCLFGLATFRWIVPFLISLTTVTNISHLNI